MSLLRHRSLAIALVFIGGIGAGSAVTTAMAGPGPVAGPVASKTIAAAAPTPRPTEPGKARVAKGVIVIHAGSKLSDAELAKMRPQYNELKPRIHSNTD